MNSNNDKLQQDTAEQENIVGKQKDIFNIIQVVLDGVKKVVDAIIIGATKQPSIATLFVIPLVLYYIPYYIYAFFNKFSYRNKVGIVILIIVLTVGFKIGESVTDSIEAEARKQEEIKRQELITETIKKQGFYCEGSGGKKTCYFSEDRLDYFVSYGGDGKDVEHYFRLAKVTKLLTDGSRELFEKDENYKMSQDAVYRELKLIHSFKQKYGKALDYQEIAWKAFMDGEGARAKEKVKRMEIIYRRK